MKPLSLRLLRLLSIVAFASLLLAGCHADSRAERKKKGEVVLNLAGDPKTLDPGHCEDVVAARAISAFVRGLTVIDAKGKPQPEIAERWEVSPDGKTYDIYLRPSKWTNGEPVVAGDFVYAWLDRVLSPKFAAVYAYMLFYIEGAEAFYKGTLTDRSKVGVEAVAPNHLRVRLTAPAPFFPQVLAHHAYYPICPSVDRANPQWALRAETYVGNGPFKLGSYAPGDRLIGVKNEGYWNAANVAMNKLTYRCIEEESTERITFENGEMDSTYAAPRPDLEKLKAEGVLHSTVETSNYYLNLNMKHPAFADVRVRRALNLAIDRASITKNVTRAGEPPALSLVPPGLYDGPIKQYFKDADFTEARKLLGEAGYPGGKGFPKLRYIYNTQEMHRAISQVIQENWKRELGIDIEIDNQEFKVVIENRHQGNYDIARNGWVADFADPLNFLDLFLSYSGNNDSFYNSPAYDHLVEQARDEADPRKRMELLRQAEDLLMTDLPIIPVFFYVYPYLAAPELEGHEVSPLRTTDVAKLRWKTGG